MIGFLLIVLIPDARAAYYASRTSDKYHTKTCRLVSRIKPSKLLVFKTPEKAAKAGYKPCPVCKPKKPKKAVKKRALVKQPKSIERTKKKQPAKRVDKTEAAKPSKVEKQDERAKSREAASETSARIHEIRFEKKADGMEKVFIRLNGFYLPEVKSQEGTKPAIQLFYKNGSMAPDRMLDIETGGYFIRRIKVQKNDFANQLMVTLEMQPNTPFLVNPFFYEEENIYALEISKRENTASEQKAVSP